jgi:hypothetical protein
MVEGMRISDMVRPIMSKAVDLLASKEKVGEANVDPKNIRLGIHLRPKLEKGKETNVLIPHYYLVLPTPKMVEDAEGNQVKKWFLKKKLDKEGNTYYLNFIKEILGCKISWDLKGMETRKLADSFLGEYIVKQSELNSADYQDIDILLRPIPFNTTDEDLKKMHDFEISILVNNVPLEEKTDLRAVFDNG